jgi:O-antigen/teichoic acid export membrane protein
VSRSVFWNALLVPVAFVLSTVMSIVIRRAFGLGSGVYDVVSGLVGSVLLYSSLGLSTALTKFLPELEVTQGRRAVLAFLARAATARGVVVAAVLLPLNLAAELAAARLNLGVQGLLLLRLATLMVIARAVLDLGVKTLSAFLAQREVNLLALAQSLTDPAFIAVAIVAGFGIPGVIGALAASSALMGLGSAVFAARIIGALPAEPSVAASATTASRSTAAGFAELTRFAAFTYVYELSLYFAGPAFACPALSVALGDPGQVALFSTGFYVAFNLVGLVVAGFRGVYRPMFAHLRASGDPEKLRAAFSAVTKAQVVMLVPVGVGLYVMSADYLPLLYGAQFSAGVWTTRVLVALLFTETAFNLGLIVLSVDERYRPVLASQALLVVAAPLFLAAARFGGVAAGAAVLGAARVAAVVSGYLVCRREYEMRFPWAFTARVAGASGVMALVLVAGRAAWPTSAVEALVLTAAGGAVFAVAMRLGRVIGPEERALLERAKLPGGRILVRWLAPNAVIEGAGSPRA